MSPDGKSWLSSSHARLQFQVSGLQTTGSLLSTQTARKCQRYPQLKSAAWSPTTMSMIWGIRSTSFRNCFLTLFQSVMRYLTITLCSAVEHSAVVTGTPTSKMTLTSKKNPGDVQFALTRIAKTSSLDVSLTCWETSDRSRLKIEGNINNWSSASSR